MSRMHWFRMYAEMVDDPKVGTLSDPQFRTWVELLCLACGADNGGDTNLTEEETSWKLRRNVSETLQELFQRNLVTTAKHKNDRETLFIPKWVKRQYQSDKSTERVRKHREKLKKEKCNVPVTFQERPTDTDTDTDTDKEYTASGDTEHPPEKFYLTKKGKKLTGNRLEAFDRFWETFDWKRGKAEAADEWWKLPLAKNGELEKILAGAKAEAENRPALIKCQLTPIWAKRWLSGRRWEDEGLEGASGLAPDNGPDWQPPIEDLIS